MSTTPFFRLPIISFLVTFCVLFAQLISKLHQVDTQYMNYNYSPDFIRIIGLSLFMMLAVSICLNKIKIYGFTFRNILFVAITVLLSLFLSYWLDICMTDTFSTIWNIQIAEGYQNFVFWYPLISRIGMMLAIFVIVAIMTYIVKHYLHWSDETCNVDLVDNQIAKRVQLIYFITGYLAINFLLQRYLYISVYMYLGNGDVPEFQNFSFYLSSVMTAFLLMMYMKQDNDFNYHIHAKVVLKTIAYVIVSQLIISIIVSIITIYAVQYYFVFTMPDDEIGRYTHYLWLLYAMLNSIFAVSILICLLTYLAGRWWLKRVNYLSKI